MSKPDQFQYIRDTYGVDAHKGKRVKYSGDTTTGPIEGKITKSNGLHIFIRFDGDEKDRGPFHPTWALEYLAA